MRRRKKHGAPNHERWVVSYADFMTLLFAFFVVLFASSQADTKKQKALAQAMQAAFSQSAPEVGGAGVVVPVTDDPYEAMARAELLKERALRERLVAKAAEIGMRPDSVVLRTTPEGLVISLREYGFFASGSSVVREPAVPILVELARALPEGLVRVEGHTDTVPIHTAQFPSNWELSSARAAAIARILLEYGRVAPGDVAVEGLAEFHPVEGNDTEAERAENRRVDVIVLRRTMLPKSPGF
jgi:chemotaxis protein MotB